MGLWKVKLGYKLSPAPRIYTLTRTQQAEDGTQAIHLVQVQLQRAEPRAYVVSSDARAVEEKK